MSKVEDFLTKSEEAAVIEAIRLAETATSGEIRIHIEKTTSKAAYERALEVFHMLEMHQTQLKNGVLIYVAVQDRAFAICGDQGIHEIVGDDFWDKTKEVMAHHFKAGRFMQGLVDGITMAGEQLKTHFPCTEDDTNELSNEISVG
jgi:uncharacterized membrane protein